MTTNGRHTVTEYVPVADLDTANAELALAQREVAELTAALTESRTQAATYANEIGALKAELEKLRAERDAFRDSALHYAARVSDLTIQVASARKTCEAYKDQPPPLFQGPGLSERGEGYNAGTRDMARAVLVALDGEEPDHDDSKQSNDGTQQRIARDRAEHAIRARLAKAWPGLPIDDVWLDQVAAIAAIAAVDGLSRPVEITPSAVAR